MVSIQSNQDQVVACMRDLKSIEDSDTRLFLNRITHSLQLKTTQQTSEDCEKHATNRNFVFLK